MSLRHAVLGLLAVAPASGYELAKHFQDTLPRVWYARNNQLYPELAKLSADGHVEVAEEGPRGRRTYAITDTGREELRRWLVDVEPDRTMRSETYLRAFLLTFALDREDALAVLRREAAVWRVEHDGLQKMIESATAMVEPDDAHVLSFELGLRLSRAMLDWTEEAARRIERRERS